MLRTRTAIRVLAALGLLSLAASAGAYSRNSPASQAAAEHAAAQKRKAAKEAEAKKEKAAEGLKEWKLSGTLKGTGAAIQFVPDKPAKADEKEIASITLGGAAREELEALLKGKKLSELVGHRLQVACFGAPERHGDTLQFSVLSGGIKEWRSVKVLQ